MPLPRRIPQAASALHVTCSIRSTLIALGWSAVVAAFLAVAVALPLWAIVYAQHHA